MLLSRVLLAFVQVLLQTTLLNRVAALAVDRAQGLSTDFIHERVYGIQTHNAHIAGVAPPVDIRKSPAEIAAHPIPTLQAREIPLGKRDMVTQKEHAIMLMQGSNFKVKLTQPEGEPTWCWMMTGSGTLQGTPGKAHVHLGSWCYFYEYPCDPGAGKADLWVGWVGDGINDFAKGSNFTAYGCMDAPDTTSKSS